MTNPKVYLVGAGPGDPELLTLRARRLIDGADVILYDQLVGDEIIATLPTSAELVSVGKYAGRQLCHRTKSTSCSQSMPCAEGRL